MQEPFSEDWAYVFGKKICQDEKAGGEVTRLHCSFPFGNDSSVEVKEGGATVQTIVVSLIVIKSFLGLGGDVPGPFYWATKKS